MKFGLTTETFKTYVPLIVEQVEDYVKKSPFFKGPKGTVSLAKIIPEITIFTASRSLQGKEVRDALDGSFAADLHDLDLGFNPMNFLIPSLPTPGNRRRDIAQRKMAKFYMGVIKKRRQNPETSADKTDMVWNLMDRKYKDGTPVTDRDVAHMMIALLMAGQHTSMATIMWVILHLAQQPKLVYVSPIYPSRCIGDGLYFDTNDFDTVSNCGKSSSLFSATPRALWPMKTRPSFLSTITSSRRFSAFTPQFTPSCAK